MNKRKAASKVWKPVTQKNKPVKINRPKTDLKKAPVVNSKTPVVNTCRWDQMQLGYGDCEYT